MEADTATTEQVATLKEDLAAMEKKLKERETKMAQVHVRRYLDQSSGETLDQSNCETLD